MNPHDQKSTSTRRRFIGATATGAMAAAQGASASEANAPPAPGRNEFCEPTRQLPLLGDNDVVVCGAGPAGVAAAVTAARTGAKVRLFEWRGCLGGVWTAGLLGYLLDFDKTGFARELTEKLAERGYRNGTSRKSISYQPEGMKRLLEELCLEAGVQFQFHTRVAAAYRTGRRLTTIVTESKSGREAWQAPVFIDTTGDGDVGALASCGFEFGEASDCPCQPMSLNALLVCKDAAALEPFLHGADPSSKDGEAKNLLRAEIEKTGHFPSYSKPTLWQVRDNLLLVMMNHEYGVKPFDAAEVTAATVRARAEINKIVDGLRKLGGPWDGLQLAATAEQIGVRDGRRLAGRFTVTKDDVIRGSKYDDAVTRPTFPVDIHAPTAEINKTAAYTSAGIKVVPYDIPLRALIARDVDGLMMAGRCISGDFIAHSSYRVTGNAVAMGEAAGAIAAIAARTKRLPHEVAWSEGAAAIEKIHAGRTSLGASSGSR
jgi:hypothetical protein